MLIVRLLRDKHLLQLQVQALNAPSQPWSESVQWHQGRSLHKKSNAGKYSESVFVCLKSNRVSLSVHKVWHCVQIHSACIWPAQRHHGYAWWMETTVSAVVDRRTLSLVVWTQGACLIYHNSSSLWTVKQVSRVLFVLSLVHSSVFVLCFTEQPTRCCW